MERQLFNSEGHVRGWIADERARELLDQINALRRKLGWLSLDMQHHQVWQVLAQ